MVSKPELLRQLTNTKNNYVLGLAAISAFTDPAALEHLRQSHTSFGAYTVTFEQVAQMLASDDDRQIALKEFLAMHLRALLKESFELIRDYAEDSKQGHLFRAQSWYQFARMLRNCLSHDFHFRFTPHDHKLLPVYWKSRKVDASLDRQLLPIAFLGYDGTWALFQEFEQFAGSLLN